MSRLEEYKKKKRQTFKKRALILGFLFLFLLFLITIFSRWQGINISEVAVSGNKIVETESILYLAKADLAGRYFWLFPKSNSFIYPEKKIKKELLQNFQRLSEVNLNIKNEKTLEITVQEREAKYLWCGDKIPEVADESDQKCYFADTDGYIFDNAPYFSGSVYFKFYGDVNGAGNPTGFYFEQEFFQKVISFKDNLEKMNLKPVSFEVKDRDFYFDLSSGGVIIFKKDADYEKLAENLQAAISTEPLKSDFAKKSALLLYIDLRFGNKVYYKFQ